MVLVNNLVNQRNLVRDDRRAPPGKLLKSNLEDACIHRAHLTTRCKQMANDGGGVLLVTPCFSRWPMEGGGEVLDPQ